MNYFYIVTQAWLDPNGNAGIQGFIFKEYDHRSEHSAE